MANVRIIDDFIKVPTHARTGTVHEKKWIVIHETGNTDPGASAKSHAEYIKRVAAANVLYLSWHYTVDDSIIYHHMPDNEIGWHAGDGNKDDGGNYAGIGIEICVNPESDFERARDNAASLVADLLLRHRLPLSAVRQHYHFSGKNCPKIMREQGLWDSFLQAVQRHLLHAAHAAKRVCIKKKAAKPVLREGSSVMVSGKLYTNSYGGVAMGEIDGTHMVTLFLKERPCGVLLDGNLGWVRAQDCVALP